MPHMPSMTISLRQTRSMSRATGTRDGGNADPASITPIVEHLAFPTPSWTVTDLPTVLQAKGASLRKRDWAILRPKQRWLQQNQVKLPKPFTRHRTSVNATLIFAQEAAGTAVCISSRGLIITCSHCVAEAEEDLDLSQTHWLLTCDGRAIAAKCVAWDSRRDLALLQVTAAQQFVSGTPFPFASIANELPPVGSRIVCAGHPGSEDLEATEAGIATGYDVLHVSVGTYHGTALGQDVHDNSDIGALMHDAWTYWGHSGAPLFSYKTGQLVGLHSSWDDVTGMRRGICLDAIQQFVAEYNRR